MMSLFEVCDTWCGTPFIIIVVVYFIFSVIFINCIRPLRTSRRQIFLKHFCTGLSLLLFWLSLYGMYNFQVPQLLTNLLHAIILHVFLIFFALTAVPSDEDYTLTIQPRQKLLGPIGNLAFLAGFFLAILLTYLYPIKYPSTDTRSFYTFTVITVVLFLVAFLMMWYGLRVRLASKFQIRAGRPERVVGTLELVNGNWVETREVTENP